MENQIDFGTLDSSITPDLTLNSATQNRLSLQLNKTESNLYPTTTTTNQNQNQVNLHRYASKRWTSFSELGKSVLRFNSLDRSTIHGTSSPYRRPQFDQTNNSNNNNINKMNSNSSISNYRPLYKLFTQDRNLINNNNNSNTNSTNQLDSNSPHFTLPIIPTMSESFDTSFDEAINSITERNLNSTDIIHNDISNNSIQNSFQVQPNHSIISFQSDPTNTFTPPTSSLSHAQIESSDLQNQPSTETKILNSIEESNIKSINEQVSEAELPNKDDPTLDIKLKNENQVFNNDIPNNEEEEEEEENETNPGRTTIEMLNSSEDSNTTENKNTDQHQPITTQQDSQTEHTTTSMQEDHVNLGKKKKLGSSTGFFKLLLIKGLTHLKTSAIIQNDPSKISTLPRTNTQNH